MEGATTARLSVQMVAGDRAFRGTDELDNPPPQADIDWRRTVYAVEIYHQVSTKVGIAGVIPYYEQDSDNNAIGTSDHDSGLGDITLYGTWAPWATAEPGERRFLDPGGVSFMIGVSIPSGDDLSGELPGLHTYHLGSGSAEYKFGARYTGRLSDSTLLFGGAAAVIDGGPNRTGFKYGNSADLYAGVMVKPIERLSTWLALDMVWRAKDGFSGLDLDDSGGLWWYLELGAGVDAGAGIGIEVSVDIPVYIDVNGSQPVADWIVGIGARYRF